MKVFTFDDLILLWNVNTGSEVDYSVFLEEGSQRLREVFPIIIRFKDLQVYYNAKQKVKNIVTEIGAGQSGSSLAFACSLFGIGCEAWQVRASYDQKPNRKLIMQTWGAKVHPSPSNITEARHKMLRIDPSSPVSLFVAISESVEIAAANEDTKYCLGSVLNHVLLHQTVIGEECIRQMEAIGETLDIVIGCTGGGSNFAGLSFPFIIEKLNGKINPVIRAVEPSTCPSLTKGVYAYDFGNTAGMTPLMKMHTLGHDFNIPDPIHAGGLRYHEAIRFARSEGLIPAGANSCNCSENPGSRSLQREWGIEGDFDGNVWAWPF
ncbi:Tryptophan synthase beta chain 2 [Hibiscus syriacus]|uniref:tryptophan synthase n=1 Tax=Hibiscus syriacus TaxID=106335 RepID=A0A6A2YIX7_HIBSY|nr:Tryptophan synthase beta chain 2 [Hibiscus syriacus]